MHSGTMCSWPTHMVSFHAFKNEESPVSASKQLSALIIRSILTVSRLLFNTLESWPLVF